MKKFSKAGMLIFVWFVIAVMLCGCGNSSDKSVAREDSFLYGDTDEISDNSVKSNSNPSADSKITKNRKIIEYVTLTVETKTFDKLINDINTAVEKSGGYIQNSETGGNSYYGIDRRTAQMTIRIPKTKQSDFSDFVSKNGNVVNRSVNTEDVTDSYIDTQSRIKALTLEKETLEKLLTQSSTMSDTLTVYEKLTNVIAEIESYQGKLNQMDNLIEYTTFTLYIDEVEKETNTEKQNWFKKTWNGLLNNLSGIGNGFLDVVSFLIMTLPYWILVAVIAVVIILMIRRFKRKNK